ncbi:MAG: hypothetical protein V1907_03260 [Candidatus Kerfeldbacteria bacterium]
MLKKSYIFGIIIVLAVLVAGGTALVMQSGKEKTTTGSTTNTTTTNGAPTTFNTGAAQPLLDADADGLTDAEEQKLGTNPANPDTDKDGLSDFDEVEKYHSNPSKSISGSLKVNDGEAIKKGIDPTTGSKLFAPVPATNVNT